ncbi:hypothetical protein [Hyphomonas sp.]|jgi:hypothetical protein|uniref:hypothetical protein n=1 Tax=Hyphomonas sp. TaxID=87 RepID=UPI0025BC3FA0|nr:hypothetical protein [Hyphomonas sp.]
MLKLLVIALLAAAVIAFFVLRQTPKRPPRDWRHGSDDAGPVPPTVQVGSDTGRKPANDAPPGGKPEPATTDSGGDGGGD